MSIPITLDRALNIMMRRILGGNISQRTTNRQQRSDESTLNSASGYFAEGSDNSNLSTISSKTSSFQEGSQASTLSGSSRSYSQKSNYGRIENQSSPEKDPVKMAMKRAGLTPELEGVRKVETFFQTGIVQPVGHHIGTINPNEYDVHNLNQVALGVSANHQQRMAIRDRINQSANRQDARGR